MRDFSIKNRLNLGIFDAQAVTACATAVDPAVPEKLSGLLGAAPLERMQRATLGAGDGCIHTFEDLVGLVVDDGAGLFAGDFVHDGGHAVVLAGALPDRGVLKLGGSFSLSRSLRLGRGLSLGV